MKYYITFGGQAYDVVSEKALPAAKQFGADKILVYDDYWLLQQDFYKQNKWLWDHHQKKGFGWYCWKPYIIWKTLEKCNDGDIVLYADADAIPIADLNPLYNQCKKDGGIMLFAAEGHKHGTWCKIDCYVTMGQVNYIQQPDLQHGVARFMLFEKGVWKASQFLMEWLTYNVNPLSTTFDPSVIYKEMPHFKEHRCEQAIMTNLAHKYGLELYREADESGNISTRHTDIYPQTFIQWNPNCNGNNTQTVGNGSRFRNVSL